MAVPRLSIVLRNLRENLHMIKIMLGEQASLLQPVIKQAFCTKEIIESLLDSEYSSLCVSSINTARYIKSNKSDVLLTLISPCSHAEGREVFALFDASFHINSKTVIELFNIINITSRTHDLMLVFDWGDGREGWSRADLESLQGLFDSMPYKYNIALAVTRGCLKDIPVSPADFDSLLDLKNRMEVVFQRSVDKVSIGGSFILNYHAHFTIPTWITNLRCGEAWLTGTIPFSNQTNLKLQPPFFMDAEILDVKKRDVNTEVIIGVGEAHTALDALFSETGELSLVGAAGEISVWQINTVASNFSMGDMIRFRCHYRAAERALLSPLVQKTYERN